MMSKIKRIWKKFRQLKGMKKAIIQALQWSKGSPKVLLIQAKRKETKKRAVSSIYVVLAGFTPYFSSIESPPKKAVVGLGDVRKALKHSMIEIKTY